MTRNQIDREFVESALMMQAGDLAALLDDVGGRSAMVRVFVDDHGRTITACNMYGPSTIASVGPMIEFRREL